MKRILFCFALLLARRAVAQDAVAVLPFERTDKAIILKVKLNDQPKTLRLIFDTGASGLAVTDSLAKELNLQITGDKQTDVVGGRHHIKISAGNTIHLNGVSIYNQSIGIFSTMIAGVDGIIGNSLFRRYVVRVDSKMQKMYLYEPDKAPNAEGSPVHFDMQTGVPVIAGQLSLFKDQPLDARLVFDTGAGYSLICFRPFVIKNRLLVGGFKPERMASTTSLGTVSPTFEGHAYSFTLTPLAPITSLPVSLMAGLGGDETAARQDVDGSLGMKFISRYNFTIDLQHQTIYLSPLNL